LDLSAVPAELAGRAKAARSHSPRLAAMDGTMRPALCHSSRIAPTGYAGHYPAKVNKMNPEPREHRRKTSNASDASDAGMMSQRSMRAIPGYKGYVPGKNVEPVYGKTFKEANVHAVGGRTRGANFDIPMKPGGSAPQDLHHSGTHVPGYAGFVPGRKADNMFAKSTARAAKEGWIADQRTGTPDMYSRAM